MSKIIYQDKTFLQELAEIPEINKVTDNNMNSIKKAVNENGQYVSATESNGEFTCTLEGSISQNDIVHILFDTNSTAAPASLSVDGGNTFLNILDASGNSIDASELSGQSVSLKNAGSHFEIETLNSYSSSKAMSYSADYVNGKISDLENVGKTVTFNNEWRNAYKAAAGNLTTTVPINNSTRTAPTFSNNFSVEIYINGWKTCTYEIGYFTETEINIRIIPPSGTSLTDGNVYLIRFSGNITAN